MFKEYDVQHCVTKWMEPVSSTNFQCFFLVLLIFQIRVTFVQMFYYFIKIPYRIAIKCSYNLKYATKSQTNVKKKI